MCNKEIVKYFYEKVVSQNLINEVFKFVSNDCEVKVGEKSIHIGVNGMKQHLIDVKKTYPDYTMKIIRQYCDGDYVITFVWPIEFLVLVCGAKLLSQRYWRWQFLRLPFSL